MHTILGAGGTIGTALAVELVHARQRVRLVGRNPGPIEGVTDTVCADLLQLDQAIDAVSGSAVVYLVAGLKYDARVWREHWPRIMGNAIEACKRANARLVFFDNVYMYGKVIGPMTEETPFNPCSEKGEIRARVATTLLNEIKAGGLHAIIARSADFYGPHAPTSVASLLVFDKFAKGAKASWLVDDSVPHSFTYVPDCAKCLALLAGSESAWNQTWHVPTAGNPPTGKQFIALAAKEFAVEPNYRVLGRPLIKLAGFFDANIGESYEMLYQSDSPYHFDSSKFSKAFGLEPTTYREGIRLAALGYKAPKPAP
jgi:nucleoside-diphosphate-sugar epimerase